MQHWKKKMGERSLIIIITWSSLTYLFSKLFIVPWRKQFCLLPCAANSGICWVWESDAQFSLQESCTCTVLQVFHLPKAQRWMVLRSPLTPEPIPADLFTPILNPLLPPFKDAATPPPPPAAFPLGTLILSCQWTCTCTEDQQHDCLYTRWLSALKMRLMQLQRA